MNKEFNDTFDPIILLAAHGYSLNEWVPCTKQCRKWGFGSCTSCDDSITVHLGEKPRWEFLSDGRDIVLVIYAIFLVFLDMLTFSFWITQKFPRLFNYLYDHKIKLTTVTLVIHMLYCTAVLLYSLGYIWKADRCYLYVSFLDFFCRNINSFQDGIIKDYKLYAVTICSQEVLVNSGPFVPDFNATYLLAAFDKLQVSVDCTRQCNKWDFGSCGFHCDNSQVMELSLQYAGINGIHIFLFGLIGAGILLYGCMWYFHRFLNKTPVTPMIQMNVIPGEAGKSS